MGFRVAAAPNAFKGSLTPARAARAMAEGITKAGPDIEAIEIPVSDGGDGLINAIHAAAGGIIHEVPVRDPRMRPMTAEYLWMPEKSTAVIEMALASGLALLPRELQDPFLTSTLGTGDLVKAALDQGATHILMGIGGSATNDGGIGAASALGYRFLDDQGTMLSPVGASLSRIRSVDTGGVDPRVPATRFSVACDVTNPLTGPLGAARVFGPQKGATSDQVEALDRGLKNLARVIRGHLGTDIEPLQGAGAAGGLGGGMKAFFNATLCPGINLVLDLIGFKERIRGTDLVLTGEGCIDGQTRFNKAPAGVAMAARSMGVPCLAICGSIGEGGDRLTDIGLDAVLSLCRGPVSLTDAMAGAADLLSSAAQQAVQTYITGRKFHDR